MRFLLPFAIIQAARAFEIPSPNASPTRGTPLGVASPFKTSSKEKASERATLYEILGASPDDSVEEMKLKYRELAKRSHPDSGSTVEGLDFGEIAAAWSILSIPRERLDYDRGLNAQRFSELVSGLADSLMDVVVGRIQLVFGPLLAWLTAFLQASIEAVQEGYASAQLAVKMGSISGTKSNPVASDQTRSIVASMQSAFQILLVWIATFLQASAQAMSAAYQRALEMDSKTTGTLKFNSHLAPTSNKDIIMLEKVQSVLATNDAFLKTQIALQTGRMSLDLEAPWDQEGAVWADMALILELLWQRATAFLQASAHAIGEACQRAALSMGPKAYVWDQDGVTMADVQLVFELLLQRTTVFLEASAATSTPAILPMHSAMNVVPQPRLAVEMGALCTQSPLDQQGCIFLMAHAHDVDCPIRI